MSFGTLPNALVVIAVVVVVLARRLSWSELENSDTDVWRGPLLLTGVGIYQLYDRHTGLGVVDVVLLVIGTAVALVAGTASGRVAQVERRAGKVFFRLGLPGLGIMVAYLVIRIGLAGVGHLLGASVSGGPALMVSLGANLLTQSLVIQSKARRDAEEYSTR
ncbi:hypothetical protein [Kribbella kalugense]|uniref:DUF1453 domain-containing protein n=1 Tax=Kribbella kalugense TaxID=2512221 RepID=A0A4R8A3C1_9ACTN|nr:hypothetical protein [Kribbella kalugense]TDW23918.1 hypothetical protein EV650_2778 [Kribbella kalugense]